MTSHTQAITIFSLRREMLKSKRTRLPRAVAVEWPNATVSLCTPFFCLSGAIGRRLRAH